jgi:signal transduction histidine kinase
MSEELRQWANELERKVEERTCELAESKRQIEESYQKLQELDQLKSKFFANISHELRTPITLILAPTEMMLNRNLGDLTKDQEKYLTIMQTNSIRLLKLINNLLDLAKIDAGKMELYYNRADFPKFISGVVTSVSPMAEKKSLALRFESDERVPEFFFDSDKIEKVILNLVFNALKFTERGGITVSCSLQQDHVLVKVSDTGIGIPKQHMPKLFSRFSQADSSASRKYEGTGIGLALAKELVELHHGRIWAESEEGRGTTFFFTIPIYTRLEEVPGALDRRTEALPVEAKRREEDLEKSLQTEANYAAVGIVSEKTLSEDQMDQMPKGEGHHRILLIDDNPDMLSYIASQLKNDYRLLFAKDGREGVDRATSDLPELIISDVMMPYKDGYQLCREVKESPQTCHIPVILLTAKTDLSTKIEGLEHGADDYLTKPFNSQELRARVRSLLNLRKLEREIQLRSHQLEETLRELKETQSQLVQSEKMAALGLLVAGVAHEINNPVSFAKGSLAIIRRSLEEIKNANRLTPAEVTELIEDIETSAHVIKNGLDRTENIIKNLKSFVRKDEEVFKTLDLHEGFESTLQLFRHEIAHRITLHRDYGKIPPIEGIPGQINQVFLNILQNAVQSIADQGEIFIKTEQIGDQVRVSIRDTGCGISEKNLPHIFDPFFTTKEAGKGTGLGMTITYRIIEGHHGRIEVKSKVGAGTEVIVLLPVTQPTDSKEKEGRGLYAGSAPI